MRENLHRRKGTVGRFGEKLRRERELRGITLEEVALATKIGTRNLRALEEEKFSQLPGGIFNKGFVKAYARYVGIDEEQAISDYVAASKESLPSDEVDVHLIAKQFEASRATASGRKQGAAAFVWSLVAVFAIVSASVGGWPYLQKWLADRAETRRQQLHPDSITALQASLPQPVQAASTPATSSASQPNTAQSGGASGPPVSVAVTLPLCRLQAAIRLSAQQRRWCPRNRDRLRSARRPKAFPWY